MNFGAPSLVVLVAFVAVVYKFYIYPVIISPLSKIPTAHWSCSFSPLWLLWMRWTHQENRTVYQRHMELGPAVRLAPNVISINSYEDGLKKIYQGGFPKPRFYFRGFAIYNTENIFTFEDNASHSSRKRLISNRFSKSFIMSSLPARAATRDVLFGRYLPIVRRAATEGRPLDVLELNYAYSMDTFVQWQYGRSLGSNLLEDLDERKLYLDGFFAPYNYLFWQYEFPDFAKILRKVGIFLIPKWVDTKFGAIEDWNLDKCDKAQQLLASGELLSMEDQPVIFEQAVKTMSDLQSKPKLYPQRLQIASDMFAHNSAAFETSGNSEAYLFYEMSRHPEWQTRLRQELETVHPPLKAEPGRPIQLEDIPDPKDIDALPILHAVIMESLRLYSPVPGGQPRIVPQTCSLAGYDNIPAGTTVQSYAYSLHRIPSVFPEPHEWRPERWLNSSPKELSDMKHWFWAFGSGGRMCIGMNFAFYSMKFLVAGVYASFTSTLHEHGDMELADAYLAGPKGHKVGLKFHSVH